MPTTDQTKPFKSYDEQIALLRERGLIITDDVYARDVLKRMNYYRFSAYSLTLRENDRFFPEVTLQDMVALYDFDQEFRSIIFKYGAVVETVARAYIAYYHARQHGPIGYLNNQNFESEQYHAVFLSTLNREISRSDEPFIVHHKRDKRGVNGLKGRGLDLLGGAHLRVDHLAAQHPAGHDALKIVFLPQLQFLGGVGVVEPCVPAG